MFLNKLEEATWGLHWCLPNKALTRFFTKHSKFKEKPVINSVSCQLYKKVLSKCVPSSKEIVKK